MKLYTCWQLPMNEDPKWLIYLFTMFIKAKTCKLIWLFFFYFYLKFSICFYISFENLFLQILHWMVIFSGFLSRTAMSVNYTFVTKVYKSFLLLNKGLTQDFQISFIFFQHNTPSSFPGFASPLTSSNTESKVIEPNVVLCNYHLSDSNKIFVECKN